MATYRGVNGVSRKVKEQYRGIAGINRRVSQQVKTVGGVNRNVFTKGKGRFYLYNRGARYTDFGETDWIQYPTVYNKIKFLYNSNNILFNNSPTGTKGSFAGGLQTSSKINITDYDNIVMIYTTTRTGSGSDGFTLSLNSTTSLATNYRRTTLISFTANQEKKWSCSISGTSGSFYVSLYTYLFDNQTFQLLEWYLE